MVLAALAIAGLPNIYTIANLLGIRMAPDWYLASAFAGKQIKNVVACLFALVNGGLVGALTAHFPTIEYCVLLFPHGLLEMSSYFLLLGAISTTNLDPQSKMPRKLLLLAGVSYAILLGAAWIEAFVTPFLAVSSLL
jgi:uncharacterized membrane protein SpoIIM required for sporulation